MPAVSSARFLIEIDGVTEACATEVSGIGIKHEPVKLPVGCRPNPYLGRSNYECEEVTVKHGYAISSTGRELFQWFSDFIRGIAVERRTFRLLQMHEDGATPAAIWEMIECVPTAFMHEANKGDSNDAAYFTVKFKPTDIECVTAG